LVPWKETLRRNLPAVGYFIPRQTYLHTMNALREILMLCASDSDSDDAWRRCDWSLQTKALLHDKTAIDYSIPRQANLRSMITLREMLMVLCSAILIL